MLALLENLSVRGGECGFGVECAFLPGCLGLGVLLDDADAVFLVGGGDGVLDQAAGFGVVVEKRARDTCPRRDAAEGDAGAVTAELCAGRRERRGPGRRRTGGSGGLKWPHKGGLMWPHLGRPLPGSQHAP